MACNHRFHHLFHPARANARCAKPGRTTHRHHHRLEGVRLQLPDTLSDRRE